MTIRPNLSNEVSILPPLFGNISCQLPKYNPKSQPPKFKGMDPILINIFLTGSTGLTGYKIASGEKKQYETQKE
jgi:hypothetical protein